MLDCAHVCSHDAPTAPRYQTGATVAVALGVAPLDMVALEELVIEAVADTEPVDDSELVAVVVGEGLAPEDSVAVGLDDGAMQRHVRSHELYAAELQLMPAVP